MVLVCFDSYIQEWTSWEERRKESEKAMDILGVKVDFLGLSDKDDTREDLLEAMSYYRPDVVWASGGSHKHHQWVGEIARELWPHSILYSTYDGDDLHVKTGIKIIPSRNEVELKNRALDCYRSQLEKNKPHFDAVRGGKEYYV